MLWHILLPLASLFAINSGTPVENGDNVKNIISFPYVVHVLITFEHIKTKYLSDFGCGGVILKAGIVLTAAHCIYNKKEIVNKIKITAGSVDRTDEDSEKMQTRFVSGFRIHKDYKPEKVNLLSPNLFLPCDIAMLWLRTSFIVKPNSGVQTAKLFLGDIAPDSIGMIVGWGQDENGDPSEVLKQARVRKISDDECKEHYNVGPHIFCAISLDHKCGVSLGDSGGPFIYGGLVIGIISYGTVSDKIFEGKTRSVCNHRKPVVFGDIRMYRQWIGRSLDAEAPKKKCKKDQQKFCAL